MDDAMKAHYPKGYGRHYKPDAPDFSRCCTGIYTGILSGQRQCAKKNGHGPDGAYCKQHDPIAKRARSDASFAKFISEANAAHRKNQFATECQAAIREIAAGHNDPRGLAQSIIDRLEATS